MTTNLFNEFVDNGPEAKLELIESQLIVGNTLVGSRLLLRQILMGWRARAAIALAPIEQWIEALKISFDAPIPPTANSTEEKLNFLPSWSNSVKYQPEDLLPGSRGEENSHNHIRSYITHAFWGLAEQVGGQCFGRDFVMRLGNNGFTPDLMFFKGTTRNRLFSYYLDGPAEVVIEVLRPGHEYADRVIKRDYYAAAGVPEYWIVNPKLREIEFWRLMHGEYQRQAVDADGRYRPSTVPELAVVPANLWIEERWLRGGIDQIIFQIEGQEQPFSRIPSTDNGLVWGCLPFAPELKLEPVPIQFEQYIAWCPEAKFEFWDGKPQIGYVAGIRNLIGLLLMTFGIASAVKVLPPEAWVKALLETEAFTLGDTERKAAWWKLAHQAAAMLREKYGVTRLGVIGDLVKPEPLNFWSEITLVAWDLPDNKDYEIFQELSNLSKEPRIELLEPESGYTTKVQQEAITHELVEI
jgi:Uma2 family endonuclease